MVEGRHGTAFVDLQTDGQATTTLQGFKIMPTNALAIFYQKR